MIRAWLAALMAVSIATTAAAQTTYPDKPVRFIVGFTAGSATDITARLFAQKFRGLERPGDDREHAGRRRQRRRRPRGEGGAGRHHLLLGRERRADHQSDAAGPTRATTWCATLLRSRACW